MKDEHFVGFFVGFIIGYIILLIFISTGFQASKECDLAKEQYDVRIVEEKLDKLTKKLDKLKGE